MVRCIHIAPELPPTVGGVADYTVILSHRLAEKTEGAVEPVLVHAGSESTDAIDVDVPTVDLSGECSTTVLTDAVEQLAQDSEGPAVVLLEYSGYGYAARGAPLWLMRAMKTLRARDVGARRIAVFHELFATGVKPWHSSFWLNPVQRHIAATIARSSDAILTNRAWAASWLRRKGRPKTPVRVQPVFSNMGEPRHVPPYEERESYAVVFGSASRKGRLYGPHADKLRTLLQATEVNALVDIGPPPAANGEVDGLPIDHRGVQPKAQVSEQLAQAAFGVLAYGAADLSKSGIMAAYASHGVPVFLCGASATNEDGLYEHGTHYVTPAALRADASAFDPAQGSRAICSAYRRKAHSETTADRLLSLFQ